jgi:hypothetical protein
MATTHHPRDGTPRLRGHSRKSLPTLRVRTAGGFVHEVAAADVQSATAFAEWLSGEALGALSVDLVTRPGGEPEYAWVKPRGGERAPWDAPPSCGEPVVLARCADRPSFRALGPPSHPGVVIAEELVVVDGQGREYGMWPCAMSTDGMLDCEIRVDGRRSVVRLDGGSYLVNHSP